MLVRNEMRQDSQEWLEWRNMGLGSSDVRPSQGKCKYKSRWRLWSEKKGLVKAANLSANPNVRRGKRLEPPVRKATENLLGEALEVFCGHDSDKPWRLVSFDGVITIDNCQIPVEIKCPTTCVVGDETEEELEKLSHDRFVDLMKNHANSILFEEYEPQLQYQIGLLDAPYGYFVFYFEHNNEMKIYKVPRCEKKIAEAFDAIDDMYENHIKPFVPPEKDPALDYYEPTEDELVKWDVHTMEFIEAALEERKLNALVKEVKIRKEQAASKLFSLAGLFKVIDLHGIKVTNVKPRETFQYKEYLEHKGIEISDEERKQFTKSGKSSLRLSPNRDKSEQSKLKNRALMHQQEEALKLLLGMFEDDESLKLNEANSDSTDEEYFD